MFEYKQVLLEELEEQLQLMDDEILKLEQEGDTRPRAYDEPGR